MGNCVSGCFGAEQKPADPNDRRFSHVFPTPLAKTAIIPSSDKHDDKFYFIKNEEEINKTIDKLDESTSMNDAKAAILEYTLADLRNQKNKLTYFPSYDSADNFTPVHEVDQEQERSPTESAKPLLILQAETSPSKLRRPNTLTNFSECSSSKMGKDISHGGLVIEVQKAHFLHPQFLLKHGLSKPYVVLKVYRTDMTKSRDIKNNKNWTELTKFQTMSASDSLKASWDELFEYRLSQDKKASSYSFGFTLFYMTNKDHMGFQVGEEQIFSIGSLLDQEMQIRLIDFKDPQYKGVLASTKVRFQFMHDQEILKERIVKEIKTKMERLCKIREKHPMFQFEKKSKGSIFEMTKRSFSKRGSEMSQSSTHENEEEGGYYVA